MREDTFWVPVRLRGKRVTDDSELRLCGPDCPTPNLAHRAPEPDWIGDWPVMHGESDHQVPDSGRFNGVYLEGPEAYCLCGHPAYLTCPAWPEGGIAGMTITCEATPADD